MIYLVFAGYHYYPQAGIEDLWGIYDDERTALENAQKVKDCDWVQVVRVNTETLEWALLKDFQPKETRRSP